MTKRTWWHISDTDIMTMLHRVADGEDPDMVYAEFYANSEVTRYA